MATAKAKTGTDVAAPLDDGIPLSPLEVAQQSTALSTDVVDLSQLAGMGSEEVRAQDFSIPFLRILQKGSPEVDESEGKYVPGAKAGDLFNTVTQVFYNGKTGLKVIPCLFHREYIEWIHRDEGGGFVAAYQADDPIVATAKAPEGERDLKLPNGHQLIDTYYEYVLCETPEGDVFPAVMSFTSTQVKKIRRWNSMMGQKRLVLPDGKVLSNPPVFAFYYEVGSVPEKNDQGSWHGWHIVATEKPNDRVPDQMLCEALQFYRQVKSGEAKRAPEHDQNDRGADGGEESIPGFESAQRTFG